MFETSAVVQPSLPPPPLRTLRQPHYPRLRLLRPVYPQQLTSQGGLPSDGLVKSSTTGSGKFSLE